VNVKILNGPQFSANMMRRAQKLSDDFAKAAKSAAISVKADAMLNTPVRPPDKRSPPPGGLKKSWNTKPLGKWDYIVENLMYYARYVEFGTWKMGGRHMLANACHRIGPTYHAAVRAAMKKAAK